MTPGQGGLPQQKLIWDAEGVCQTGTQDFVGRPEAAPSRFL